MDLGGGEVSQVSQYLKIIFQYNSEISKVKLILCLKIMNT